jgi:hypothetical protein
MPPGYGYLTRHLPHEATHAWLSGSASRQASPCARNEKETRLHAKIHRCSGPDSHNEHTPALKVPLQTGLRFRSRGYEQPPYQEARGTTNSKRLTAARSDSSGNDLRPGRQDSCSNGFRADAATERLSSTKDENQPFMPGGTEVQGCRRSWRSRRQRNLLRLLPPQHRTSGRRPPQSAPAGPRSRPRQGRPRT